MPQPWERDWSAPQNTTQPAAQSGPVMGAPPDPAKRAADARDQTRTTLAVEGAARDDRRETREVTKVKFDQEAKLRDDFNMNPQVKAYRNSMVMLSQALRAPKNGQGDLSVIYAYANLMDPESVVREGEMDMVNLSSPLAQSTYQRLKGQLDSSGRLPPETRRNLDQEMIRTTQARRKAYDAQFKDYGARAGQYGLDPFAVTGTHAGEMFRAEMQDYDKERGIGRFAGQSGTSGGANPDGTGKVNIPTIKGGLPEGTQIQFGMDKQEGPFDRADYIQRRYGVTPDQEDWIVAFWNGNRNNPNLTPDGVKQAFTEAGIPPPDDAGVQEGISNAQKGFSFSAFDTSQPEQEYRDRLNKMNTDAGGLTGAAAEDRTSAAGYANRAYTGATMGLGDEIRGLDAAGNAVWAGQNPLTAYAVNRDAERQLQEQSRNEQGVGGWVAEIGGSIPTAMMAPGAMSRNVGQAARAGATVGTVQGFGTGEGLGGSTINALVGGGLGAATGGAVQGGLNKLAARAPRPNALAASAINRARSPRPGISNVDDVAAAGAQEGVDVNRAMVDPALQNRVTGVDASMAGGPKFQRGMTKIEGQIEGRVNDLGQGGTPLNKVALGQQTQGAGERFIKDSGKKAGALYTRAEKMAGAAKVEPKTSLALADDILTGLSETPSTNAAEIAFLNGLKSDLSKDLSVGGLRRMRTSLRKKISKGELVFGEDEATVLKIMDAAADDITDGLQKQGLGKAAQAFKRADTEYRGRMEYINGTLQKIIGKRGSNLSAERVADNLTAMARGKDEIGVKKFMDTLTHDERIDTAATFAEALGKNGDEAFSVSHFVSQTKEKNFPQGALRVVFGEEGAASIARLRVLSKEVKRVTGAMNSRKSGTAVGNDYRSWLLNMFLGAGPGAASGNMTTAIVGGGLTLGAKAGRDIISARALLSKDITKWLEKAPKTTNPNAINAHLSQLSVVAGSQSPYRMDAQQIANYLRDAITNKSTTAAAAGEQEQN